MSNTDSGSAQSTAVEDDWSAVKDPSERRKIQNRIAQRKFRDKARQNREDAERQAENERRAAGAYSAPEPEEVDNAEEPGLPWGSVSLRHVIKTGKAREQSSRETSLYAAASKAGGSSRLGLHLIDEYARGSPAWAAWRDRIPQTR
ncbi:hypothetical protein M409DRAFT_20854 [Zasmidium cellare ATCC 36951]|uniref:BZIP domain-containing protein n=1 Tax=Zasmidium cellare ATCC 36951 TaxID=1080233 RepID=A0A6A6CST3_ZASCE|nr:uncharacterized protein M409DRAFT_20854 [Zasmidium cellare ATCC 36951]KAF2168839.1 hypothetical protein M409DRAFT_20854 [Zasmidium cellare ATCC 36951]